MRVFGWLLGELPRSVVGLHRVEAVLGEDDRVTYGETVPDTTGGPDSGTVLAQLFDGLSGDPAGAIVVEGHTSTEGSDSHNIDLSERRAQAVVDDLVSRGIDPSRIMALGKGESEPLISPDDDETARSINRRVEIVCDGST